MACQYLLDRARIVSLMAERQGYKQSMGVGGVIVEYVCAFPLN